MDKHKWKNIPINYVKDNLKQYMLVSILFIIGLFIGVLVVNSCSNEQTEEISTYINDFISSFKENNNLDKTELIMDSAKGNMILALILWLAGTTVIGIPIVFCVILFRGLCLGYTISAIAFTLGKLKGLLFCLITLFLHNIFFIPAILTIGVSSIKLYKSITKNREKENIKYEMIRHTIISGLMVLVLLISSLIENCVSIGLLQGLIKYF